MTDSPSWEDLLRQLRAIKSKASETTLWWRLWSCLIGHPWYRAALARQTGHVARSPGTIRQDAADFQQEAVLLLARDLQHSRHLQTELTAGGPQLSGLLIRIMTRHLLQVRRRFVREMMRERSLPQDVATSTTVAFRDTRIEVSLRLQVLPPEQRTVVALTLNGWTQPEIADRLEVHQSTVSRCLSRAIATLRDHFSSASDSGPDRSAGCRLASAVRACT